MQTQELCSYINKLLLIDRIRDFPNACNGLQIDNEGTVTHVGGAVDANPEVLRKAIACGVDFLIVHHGLLFYGVQAFQGIYRQFIKDCFDHHIALYGAHLPLDIHPKLSHNVSVAKELKLTPVGHFAPFEGQMAGLITSTQFSREQLKQALEKLLAGGFHKIEFGPECPQKLGIVCGSGGQSLLDDCVKNGIDTLITGEIRHSAFTFAQLHQLNIYACGHYATEVFGVKNLLENLSQRFQVPCTFLDVPSGL